MTTKPALALAAASGRRRATIELAQEIERQGFAGIYCASYGDGLALCEAIILSTSRIAVGTGIANIYARNPLDYAATAAFLHEISDGRFRFGVGVSHAPAHARLGVTVGKPLDDMRRFVETVRGAGVGDLPPIILATLRRRMVALAGEIAEGAMWANGARSHMPASLQYLPPEKRHDPNFFIGDMLPVCIDDDRAAAMAVMKRVLSGYVMLPNYRNYWTEAGYGEEMQAIQRAIAAGETARIPELMSERWLADVTLFGSASQVREGVDAWYAAGVNTPILVPSSTKGGQMKAFQELLEAFR